ncbi:Rieske 2Fe-2S domain-containing protein [Streptomyces sp. NPDC050560]|uniref:Rieske 2Fe-2S domain-containing protein n=1 Tax=Streptomyces sp. NPDC050560 TaxID=3365630 RepID=UPI00379E14EB
MLSSTDNELLTRVGPGTSMGDMLRRYWVPALLGEELPEPGSPPLRLKLLGERLVAFRDHDGAVGVLSEFCAHRRASLFYGRTESEDSRDGTTGLRCSYHGWKYDREGHCVDMPNEPPTSKFKHHIRLRAYPARERGGIVWVYLGPPELQPELPELEWAMLPDAHRYVSKRRQRCSYLQAMEGGLDSSHVSFLHSDAPLWSPPWTHQTRGPRRHLATGSPKFFVEPTGYGLLLGARRETDTGDHYWRITQWLMPWYTMVPRDEHEPIAAHAWVPVDDETCFTWNISYVPEEPLRKEQYDYYRTGGHIHAELIPGTFDPVRNADNDYQISRVLQKADVSYSGIAGIAMQDSAMQESMGPVVDRSEEHLGSADAGIIAARRRLLAGARALAESGAAPPGLDPATHRVRSTSVVLPKETSWVAATGDSRRADPALYADPARVATAPEATAPAATAPADPPPGASTARTGERA